MFICTNFGIVLPRLVLIKEIIIKLQVIQIFMIEIEKKIWQFFYIFFNKENIIYDPQWYKLDYDVIVGFPWFYSHKLMTLKLWYWGLSWLKKTSTFWMC